MGQASSLAHDSVINETLIVDGRRLDPACPAAVRPRCCTAARAPAKASGPKRQGAGSQPPTHGALSPYSRTTLSSARIDLACLPKREAALCLCQSLAALGAKQLKLPIGRFVDRDEELGLLPVRCRCCRQRAQIGRGRTLHQPRTIHPRRAPIDDVFALTAHGKSRRLRWSRGGPR